MKPLHDIFALILAIAALLGSYSCSDGELNDLPTPIQTFVTQYFPGVEVTSYSTSSDDHTYVKLRNSASLMFDGADKWIEIDGNGVALPADLIYDQLPTPLYEYLETMEATDQVYKLVKTGSTIEVTLLDTRISYDLLTKTIVYPSASTDS